VLSYADNTGAGVSTRGSSQHGGLAGRTSIEGGGVLTREEAVLKRGGRANVPTRGLAVLKRRRVGVPTRVGRAETKIGRFLRRRGAAEDPDGSRGGSLYG
jgi:hypothetical protein